MTSEVLLIHALDCSRQELRKFLEGRMRLLRIRALVTLLWSCHSVDCNSSVRMAICLLLWHQT